MTVSLRLAFSLAVALAAALPAQNCNRTAIGSTPLSDLGTGTYQGFGGGLYGGGQNTPPAAHAQLGQAAVGAIQPLDASGAPDPAGKIVVVSIGMSNTTAEFSSWVQISNRDPLRNPAVAVVDLAQGGQDARRIANPSATFWTVAQQRLQQAGVTPEQVQVAWLKEAVAGPTDPFPAHAQELQMLLGTIAQILVQKYPNIQICYPSSRIYAGYATTMLNPEPYAYESGFSVKWLIEQQIAGDPALRYDPDPANKRAPWLAWGPYMWADGLTPRSDGLIWECQNFQPDGTHPSASGRDKVAAMLDQHFTTDPTAKPWYGGGGGGGTRANVVHYGQGCAGSAGALRVQNNSTPFLGNTQFAFGLQNGRPNAKAVLYWATARANIALPGCRLLVDPATLLLPLGLQLDGTGRTILRLSVPNEPALSGLALPTQWLVLDPGAPGLPSIGGAAMSDGVELQFGTQ